MSEEATHTGDGSDGALLTGGSPEPAAVPDAAPSGDGNQSSGELAFSSLLSDEGSFNEGWTEQLTQARPEFEGYRKTLENYKTPLDALKALGETKALVGRKLDSVETVLNPNPDDPTAIGLYRQVLGIPDQGSPEAYDFRPEGDLAEAVSEEQLGNFAEKAHELGLNRKQFAELVQYQAGIMGEMGHASVEAQEQADLAAKSQFMQGLEKSLGGKDETDKALDLTVRMLRAGGMNDETIAQDIAPHIHKMGPGFVQALANLAKNTAEDKLPGGTSAASKAISAKDEYKAVIHDTSHPKHAIYHDPLHPDHAQVRAEVRDLIRRAG